MFHTVYKTVDISSGRFYIGKHSTENPYDGYLGSGKWIADCKKAKRHLIKGVIEFCETESEALDKERQLVLQARKEYSNRCMNFADGGLGQTTEAMLRHYENPDNRRITGEASSRAQNTPEALAKRSAISKRIATELGVEHFQAMANKVDKVSRGMKMVEVNARPEKIAKQRKTITAIMNDPIVKERHTLKMREVGATPEFREATSIGTKAAVNRKGVQDKRRVYLRAKFAYIKAHGLPRYYKGATKEVVFKWMAEQGVKNG